MGRYTSAKSHPNPSAPPPPPRGFKMFYVLRYIPKAEITAVNYANLLNIRFTL